MAAEEDTGAAFEPLVKLEQVKTLTGEEEEVLLYSHRAKAYRFDADEWKERGLGDVKLLFHPGSRQARIVLREEKTMKLRLNQPVVVALELKPNLGSDRAWTWSCLDHSEGEAQQETFALKFKNADIANEFKAKYEEAQDIVEGKREPPAAAAAASASAPAAPASSSNPWEKVAPDGKLLSQLSEDQLKELFTKHDRDGNKSIEGARVKVLVLDCVRAVFAAAGDGKPLEDGLLERLEGDVEEITATVFKLAEADPDGNVTLDEFMGLRDASIV